MNDMKTAFKILRHVAPLALYALLVLEAGCQKPATPAPPPAGSRLKKIKSP